MPLKEITDHQYLALLLSDAISFTPELTERHREVVVNALRSIARGDEIATSEHWFPLLIDEGMEVTAFFDDEKWKEFLK